MIPCGFHLKVNDSGNISDANQFLRESYANFNLGHRINIQEAQGDWVILYLTTRPNHTFVNLSSRSPCAPLVYIFGHTLRLVRYILHYEIYM